MQGASCFTWTSLPLAPGVFLMSNVPSSPGSEGNMHFGFATPPFSSFISFTHFDSDGEVENLSYWHFLLSDQILVLPPSALSKMRGQSSFVL